MTADKQRAYEAKRREVTGIAAVPMVEYRVWLRGRPPFTERAIGPSQLFAHYPDMIAFQIVGMEPAAGMMGDLW